jgi:hypothetical protein
MSEASKSADYISRHNFWMRKRVSAPTGFPSTTFPTFVPTRPVIRPAPQASLRTGESDPPTVICGLTVLARRFCTRLPGITDFDLDAGDDLRALQRLFSFCCGGDVDKVDKANASGLACFSVSHCCTETLVSSRGPKKARKKTTTD